LQSYEKYLNFTIFFSCFQSFLVKTKKTLELGEHYMTDNERRLGDVAAFNQRQNCPSGMTFPTVTFPRGRVSHFAKPLVRRRPSTQ
jgi:hypothetical protein